MIKNSVLMIVLLNMISLTLLGSKTPYLIISKEKPTFITVNVKPDLSGLGQDAGSLSKDVVKGIFSGGAEGFSEAAKSGVFGQHATEGLKDISQQAAGAFSEAMRDPRLAQELASGAQGFTHALGVGAENMAYGLETDVAPHIARGVRSMISSVINAENAIRYGSIIGLQIALPMVATYTTTLVYRYIDQKLFNPKPQILLPGAKVGKWDRLNRWWASYKTPPMIFDQSVKDRLEEIQEKTKNIRDHILAGKKVTYDNFIALWKTRNR